MTSWGWQGNAYFNYAGATAAGTTSLEVSFHLFATDAGATEAMSYFAAGRALMVGLSPVPLARVGDQVLAVGGATDGGNEVTIYLRLGTFLVRISAVAPVGDPGPDALATAQGIALQAAPGGVPQRATTVDGLLPTVRDLPAGFVVTDEGRRSADEVAETFLRPAEAAPRLAAWGLQENVYRYFAIPSGVAAYPGGAVSVEVSLHLFRASDGARGALGYYADGRAEALGLHIAGTYEIGDGAVVLLGGAPNGSGLEATVYLLLANVLARVSAVSPDGDPTADALAVAWVIAGK
jgi:hypothetical protein